ncbi:DUF547 domain-containing protein [Lewinella cohaerens]|uniref:DUF547 domain-containing protein n=1 Tax=Lewinella cohaerens TaxID=70995 RepID=UPI000368623D|nr:DUF547 domain-containing protein [Lewinella cohaerens]
MNKDIPKIAADFLLALKMQQQPDDHLAKISALPLPILFQELRSEQQKKTFWINCYNAFFLHLRRNNGIDKPAIYREKLCHIAGQTFSLDEIEHGILRRYRAKLALGYLPNLFVPKLIRQLAVKEIDARIHFALNCGAISCPPIAFYAFEKIDQQLDWASQSFLESETDIFPDKQEIHFSRLGYWYLGDFGGRRGIRKIVEHYLKVNTGGYRIVFKDYNWDEDLNNFAKE